MKKIILLLLLTMFFSCGKKEEQTDVSETSKPDSIAWIEVQKQDKISSYKRFVKDFPQSKYVEMANSEIDSIEEDSLWNIAIGLNTIDAYRNFCTLYPRSVHHTEAYSRVNEMLKQDLDTKYKAMIDFLKDMNKNFDYSVLKRYQANEFYFKKYIKNSSLVELKDSILIDSEQKFTSTLNDVLFKTCLKMYNEDKTGTKNYDLKCSPTEMMIVFHRNCSDITFVWEVGKNNMKIKSIVIHQDVCE